MLELRKDKGDLMMERKAEINRKTRETEINVKLKLDGTGNSQVETGVGFFDHMLELMAKHGLIDMQVFVKGDISVDAHHSVEDAGIVLGQASSFCGVVGLKPTYGLVSRYGLVAFASSMDQIAPVTRDVADCAAVMNAIAGHDPLDSTSQDCRNEDYTSFLKNDVKGLKIGLPKEYFSGSIQKEVKEKVLDAAKLFESLGATIEEISLPLIEYALPVYYILSSAEAGSNLAQYDGIKYGYRAQQFDDLVELYKKTRSEGFGEEVKRRILLGTYVLSSGNYDAYYSKALKAKRMIFEEFQNAYQKVDIILGPTAPSSAFKIGEKTVNPIDMYFNDAYTVSANIAGLCAISLPCGFDSNGLPVGMQLIGKPYDEGTILKAAFTYEKNTGGNGGIDCGI